MEKTRQHARAGTSGLFASRRASRKNVTCTRQIFYAHAGHLKRSALPIGCPAVFRSQTPPRSQRIHQVVQLDIQPKHQTIHSTQASTHASTHTINSSTQHSSSPRCRPSSPGGGGVSQPCINLLKVSNQEASTQKARESCRGIIIIIIIIIINHRYRCDAGAVAAGSQGTDVNVGVEGEAGGQGEEGGEGA